MKVTIKLLVSCHREFSTYMINGEGEYLYDKYKFLRQELYFHPRLKVRVCVCVFVCQYDNLKNFKRINNKTIGGINVHCSCIVHGQIDYIFVKIR
jgi:hypothetical protein